MFETSVIRVKAKAPQRRAALLSMSLVAHAAAIIGVFAASVASVRLPTRAPREMTLFTMPIVPTMRGSETGGAKPKPQAAAPQQRKVQTTQPTTPMVVPDKVTPLPTATDTAGTSNSSNVLDGPPGDGTPRGTKDGVDGGMPPDDHPAVTLPPQPPVVYHVGADVKAPVVLRRVSPPYPAMAAKVHRGGFAIVDCTIDKDGRIRDAHIVSSSWAVFEEPALDAVRQWLFAPGTKNGQPVDVEFELKVTFEIH